MTRSSRRSSFEVIRASFGARSGEFSRMALTLLALAVLSVGRPAAADTARENAPDDAPARAALEEQRYEDARALVKDDLASPLAARRAPALEIVAVAMLLEGRAAEAEPYLHALYELAPAFVSTDASLPPRVTDAFAVEAARPHARAVSLAVRPSEDGSFVLEASARAQVSLACRHAAGEFAPVRLANLTPTRRGFRLPTSAANACFVMALDEDGLPVGRLGSPSAPITLRVEPKPPGRTVLTRWWFWTAVGAAVVGGVALAYVETRPQNKSLPNAELTATGRKPDSP